MLTEMMGKADVMYTVAVAGQRRAGFGPARVSPAASCVRPPRRGQAILLYGLTTLYTFGRCPSAALMASDLRLQTDR